MQRKDLHHLIQNESFLNYCFGRNIADVQYWEDWMKAHPEFKNDIDELKNAVLLLGHQIGKHEAEAEFAHLSEQINSRRLRLPKHRNFFNVLIKVGAAAVLAMVVGFGFYFSKKSKDEVTNVVQAKDIAPGSKQAVLTLADGSKINLNNAVNGTVASQAGVKIIKTANGQLLYDFSNAGAPHGKIQYNTIDVPAGGQWQVLLPDQSKVWLNSKSSLTYPTRFSGNERVVKVSGEAYFEVAHNKAMPFKVETEGQVVEVLGTHFNITAYKEDKLTKTTLLEGAVKVSKNGKSQLLKPGQQAQVDQYRINVVDNVDTEKAIAWKNGYFMFNDSDLTDVMRQLSRWYDVDVVFENQQKGYEFVGEIRRGYSLIKVLKILELSDIQFELKGRTLIVK
jgi:transmembrane sensor